jgi:hypothetical protein
MKTRLALTLLGTALLSVPAALGQATSGTVGFSSLSIPAGTNIAVPTLVNSSVFQGQVVVSLDGLTVTPSTAPGWTAGAYNATAIPGTTNYPTHYADVVSVAHEGLLLDISSNSTTALTLNGAAPVAIRGTTLQVAIRQHVTLSKAVQGATGLSPDDDSVTIFNPQTGSRTAVTYVGAPDVFQVGGNPAGHFPIYPGTGVVFTTGAPVVLNFMGEVKPTKTMVPLSSTGTNIVGTLNPATATSLFGSSLTGLLAPDDDSISVYSTNGSMTPTIYSTDGSVIQKGGVPLTAVSPDSLPLNSGAVITVSAPLTWIVNSPLAP